MSNRLAQATSPYLLQHADNPVDWWEWSAEAFAEAQRRDVPIFLSVGYSACHWCHVMAHESFENDAIAAYLNENFVSIKVDREERPDVDSIYMDATVALTGQGGWPMSVFLDNDRRPFFAGTYFPPEPRHGMPAFPQVLMGLTAAWNERRGEVGDAAERITGALANRRFVEPSAESISEEMLADSVTALASSYDARRGGFGNAPKFPPSMVLEWLLRHTARTGNHEALAMAEGTFEAMARGGMYDQLRGGFARYSVDADWIVPHFEKMLYDNALLLRAYLHWWRLTASPLALRVVRDTAEFLLKDMTTAEGGFAAALDADTEGEEGRFYVWTPEQLTDTLGVHDGPWAAQLLSVTEHGTFEHGSSTLQLRFESDDPQRWARIRHALLAKRAERVHPARDDKVVAAWNGMSIAALAEAGALLDEPSWVEAAERSADLLISIHIDAHGRLRRTSRDGRPGKSSGTLEDYACVADGLQALYSATGDDAWLAIAGQLLDVVTRHFADGEGGFFETPDDGEALIHRPRDPADNATPSGWFVAAGALLTQSAFTGDITLREAAEQALGVVGALARSPRAAGSGLAVAEALLDGPVEVAIVSVVGDPDRDVLADVARRSSRPGLALAVGESGDDTWVPLLMNRPLHGGKATAYVCRNFACQAPVTEPAELHSQVSHRFAPTP